MDRKKWYIVIAVIAIIVLLGLLLSRKNQPGGIQPYSAKVHQRETTSSFTLNGKQVPINHTEKAPNSDILTQATLAAIYPLGQDIDADIVFVDKNGATTSQRMLLYSNSIKIPFTLITTTTSTLLPSASDKKTTVEGQAVLTSLTPFLGDNFVLELPVQSQSIPAQYITCNNELYQSILINNSAAVSCTPYSHVFRFYTRKK